MLTRTQDGNIPLVVDIETKGGGGSPSQKAGLLSRLETQYTVVVVESVRTTVLVDTKVGNVNVGSEDLVIALWTRPDTLRDRLIRRSEAAGEKFNVKFWNEQLLERESGPRYLRFARKWLTGLDVWEICVDDYSAWDQLDQRIYHSG